MRTYNARPQYKVARKEREFLNLTGEIVPIGILEEFRMTKRKDAWTVWVTSRTGPSGRDQHRFTVPHDQLGQWFVDMLEAEANK